MSLASGPRYTAREIAKAVGASKWTVARIASRDDWPFEAEQRLGGQCHSYDLEDLPPEFRAKLMQAEAAEAAAKPAPGGRQFCSSESDALWLRAASRPAKDREKGKARADAVRRTRALMAERGLSLSAAAAEVAAGLEPRTSARTVERWHSVCERHAPQDWEAALVPGHGGGGKRLEIDPRARDWLKKHYLHRSDPSFALAVRRAREVAAANGWGELPSERTLRRMRAAEVKRGAETRARKGPRAGAEMYPPQRRDKGALRAGQIASGDGLKFDRLWVEWPDGEVINTSTGWFWMCVRTGYVMAHRLAKTETTTLFRLATYDLTAICLPDEVQVDNTRVAACKAMTAGAKGRRRGKDLPGDPPGLFASLGIEVQFTNPDRVSGNAGAKLIERFFGKGGIHEMVATHPSLRSRGYSKKKPVRCAEFAQVVAEEVQRWNRQEGRRSGICNGRSCEQTFRGDFKAGEARVATAEQRALLLLEPKRAQVLGSRGELTLQMPNTSGPLGRHRYWSENLENWMGREVCAYYDPGDMTQPVTVYSLDGRKICAAEHIPDVGFRDREAAREHAKNKHRYIKAQKAALDAQLRMSEQEHAAAYSKVEAEPVEPPEPGLVTPNFSQPLKAVNGEVVGGPRDAKDRETELTLRDEILAMHRQWKVMQEREI